MRWNGWFRQGVAAALIAACTATAAAADDTGELMAAAARAELNGRQETAARLYRQAHAADPAAPQPLVALGKLLAGLGDAETAAELFRSALQVAPRDREARQGLGRVLVDLDRGGEALAVFDGLLADAADDPRTWAGRGLALALNGDDAAARNAFARGLVLAPTDAELLAAVQAAGAQPDGKPFLAVELAFATSQVHDHAVDPVRPAGAPTP